MLKAKLIMIAVRWLMGGIALGLGIWYLSSSIGGASLTYTSMSSFLNAIGVQNGDIATANGCFMCGYIQKLFAAIGTAAEMFWDVMVGHLWILLAIGFGIWLFIYTAKYLYDASNAAATDADNKERKIDFAPWFDKVWKLGARILMVGVALGAIGMGGREAMRVVTNITVTPVLLVGSELAMAATGVADAAQCTGGVAVAGDVLSPVMQPFMCVVGNLNAVMLAGAGGGFAMMNYAWLGLGGGAITWLVGLGLVILFLVIGFDLFFQILSVVFKLVFLIIFLPLLLAAYAFEGTWPLVKDVTKNAIDMLIQSAVRIVAITLKILIIYATIAYTADATMPGPVDGYSAILPPLMGTQATAGDAATQSVMDVFATCEHVSLENGVMDADRFRDCFTAGRAAAERMHPGAFDFLGAGWEFLMIMIGLFALYYFIVDKKIDGILGAGGSEAFDFGTWVKDLGKRIWDIPKQLAGAITRAAGGDK
ncbi:hypothetical protein HDR63_01950 [bacterium]|nr:hypothetical protein [bacterium]